MKLHAASNTSIRECELQHANIIRQIITRAMQHTSFVATAASLSSSNIAPDLTVGLSQYGNNVETTGGQLSRFWGELPGPGQGPGHAL